MEARNQLLRWALPCSMLLAVVLRLLYWRSTAALFNDGPVFIALAQAFAAGDVRAALAHEFHPLYSAVVAVVHGLLGEPLGLGWETSAVWTSALASAGAVWALHAFVRSAFGPWQAAVAAFLLALHGAALEMGGDVQSEGLYLALFLASAASLWSVAVHPSMPRAAMAGLASGLAYLTRPEGLSLALIGGLLVLVMLVRRSWPPRTAIGVALALGLGTAVCVLPYVGALYAETGEIWITRKKSVGWLVGVSDPPGHLANERRVPDWSRLTPPPGMEVQSQRPLPRVPFRESRSMGAALSDLAHSMARAVRYEILPLLLLGLFAVRGRPGLRAGFVGSVLALHLVMLFGLALNVGYLSTRHALPPTTLLLGYAACGIVPLADLLGRLTRRQVGLLPATVLALALLAGISAEKVLTPPDVGETVQREAAIWLREQGVSRGPVAAERRRVAYYAGAPFVKLRIEPELGLESLLDAYRVRHVIVAEDAVPEYLGMSELIPQILEPIHRAARGDVGVLVLRYRGRAAASPGDVAP